MIRAAEAEAKAPAVTWRDAESRQILFTSDDIWSFDWSKQIFALKRDAALDFLAWTGTSGLSRQVVAEDKDGLIYRARWVSHASSMGYGGPIYNLSPATSLMSISDSYPSRQWPLHEDDARDSQRLRADLEKEGLLGEMRPAQDARWERLESTDTDWKNCGFGLKARLECFGDTFWWKRQARAHILFTASEEAQLQKQIDSVAIEIRLVANDGRFRSDSRIEGISPAALSRGIYVCKFEPWRPAEGSEQLISGAGRVMFSLLFQKKIAGKMSTLSRLDFQELNVQIKAPAEAN